MAARVARAADGPAGSALGARGGGGGAVGAGGGGAGGPDGLEVVVVVEVLVLNSALTEDAPDALSGCLPISCMTKCRLSLVQRILCVGGNAGLRAF